MSSPRITRRLPPARSHLDREIARLAIPAFGALIAEPLYVLTDTAVVGHLGTPQLAGLAVASSVLLTLYAVFIFLAYGTTAAVSRLLGAGDEREAAHQAVQSMWLALFIGLGVTVIGLALSGPLVAWMGAEGAVRTNALVYLRISLAGVPAMLLVLAGAGYLRGLQDTRTPLLVAIGTALANLVIEVALIYGLDQGIGASALATVLAQVGGAAVYMRRVGRAARRQGADLAPHPASLAALARVGRDLLVRTAALRVALVVTTAVAARLGSVEVAAHQIAFEIWNFLALGLDAIAIAGQAMVGRALGAGDGPAARDAGRRMIEWGVALGALVGVLVAALRTVLPHLFSDDAQVLALASFLLVWVAALQPLNAVAFVLDGVLIGAGDMRFLAWAMIAAAAVFIPAALMVLALDAGIGWLWAALALLMATRASTLLARFASGRWIVLGARR
ncbi:MAG TPA: MATE family efflux transporter [Acidimicrobiales bacterium]|nr:MATE family efflux transporter [Acidimicrobiales bacterium]